jgi:hypothetical protein
MLVQHAENLSDDSALETLSESFGAAVADAGARFLLRSAAHVGEPDDLAGLTEDVLAAADAYYRESLVRFPRSEFLLMRYVEFLMVFRGDVTLANMIVQKCATLEWGSSATRFDLFRFNRDMQRARELVHNGGGGGRGGGGGNGRRMDVITHEEVLKTLKRTRKDHTHCNKCIDKVIRAVAARNVSTARITALVEKQFELQEQALERYEFLVENVPQSAQVNERLASFLEDVMFEPEAAAAVREEMEAQRQERELRRRRASGGRHRNAASSPADQGREAYASEDGASARDSQSEGGTSSVTTGTAQWQNAINRLSTIKTVKRMRDQHLRKHALKMRLASFLLVGAILSGVIVYVVLYGSYRETLLNLNDSGVRRAMVTLCGIHARSMHLAAPAAAAEAAAGTPGEGTAAFEAAAGSLRGVSTKLLSLHTSLVYKYPYGDDRGLQTAFYTEAGVKYVVASEAAGDELPIRETLVTGADSITLFVQDAQAAAASPPAEFLSFNASAPSTFPALFAVLRNSPHLFRDLDTSTYYYQRANLFLGERLLWGMVAAGAAAAVSFPSATTNLKSALPVAARAERIPGLWRCSFATREFESLGETLICPTRERNSGPGRRVPFVSISKSLRGSLSRRSVISPVHAFSWRSGSPPVRT